MQRQVVIYKDPESDWYVVEVPSLPGCNTQGETYEQALANAKEAIELWIESAVEHGDPIPDEQPVFLATVDYEAPGHFGS